MTTKKRKAKSQKPKSRRPVTWRVLVERTLRKLGGRATLSEIYESIERHPKARANQHWQATIRRTVQLCEEFKRVKSGLWRLKDKS